MSAGYSGSSTVGPGRGANLAPYRWKPGQRPPGGGKPKGLGNMRRRFREAFDVAPPDGKESLVAVAIAIARGDAITAAMRAAILSSGDIDPKALDRLVGQLNRTAQAQINAIKFCAEWGFGSLPKNLDDETTQKLAAEMLKGMLEEARARAAANAAARAAEVPAAIPAATGGAE